ncbi:MAG: alpha/beta hydrolase-fold protein [Bacteroidota bacterium]|nr:alpha/beta hydrolase-fold protein [Bacteroidota bacterium]
MQVTYHKEYSHSLGRDMEYKIYGHQGKPVLVFPTSNGRFYQYEDSGMINAISSFIQDGKIQVWTADGIDWETFFSDGWNNLSKIERHEAYFNYIRDELVPGILWTSQENNNGDSQKIVVTGCSMGAYHAANFYFRYPWHIDTVVALSGVYSTDYFFGNYKPVEIYLNSPIDYLKNNNAYYIDRFRNSNLIFCCGQGAYEDFMLEDTYKLKGVFDEKGIHAWFDIWGNESVHDWTWWHKQIEYFLGKIL